MACVLLKFLLAIAPACSNLNLKIRIKKAEIQNQRNVTASGLFVSIITQRTINITSHKSIYAIIIRLFRPNSCTFRLLTAKYQPLLGRKFLPRERQEYQHHRSSLFLQLSMDQQ